MRIRREGPNTVSYELSYSEISNLDIDIESLKNGNINSEETIYNLQELSKSMIGTMYEHINPMLAAQGIPVSVNVKICEESIQMIFSLPPLPFEALDYADDYDEEVNLEIELIEEENCFELNIRENDEETLLNIESENDSIDDLKVMLEFKNFNKVCEFSHICNELKLNSNSDSILYKYDNTYCLYFHFVHIDTKTLHRYEYLSMEWGFEIITKLPRIAYIEEHGNAIISRDAVSTLSKI